ncbi:MAG: hypothetical protein M3R08_06825 [Bacteroidota bacterium]|nr:hypothetical protein [Bacteroidota bacterium]
MERGIFYFGRNAAMMALVGQQLKAAGMEAEGFMDEEKLMSELAGANAKLLVIGGGVEDAPRERLKSFCSEHGILVLEHFAGPGSLPKNISEVLG